MGVVAGHSDHRYRLTNESGGLGLSCSSAGVSFAGVPLLRKVGTGFAPRPTAEIESLIRAACGENAGTAALSRSLEAIAHAINRGDLAYAMTAAVLTRLPELDWNSAARLAKAEERLVKYNPDEPRDWHGRWTADGGAGRPSQTANSSDAAQNSADQDNGPIAAQPLKILDPGAVQPPADDPRISSPAEDDEKHGTPISDLESKYNDIGVDEFADQAIRFGDQLARHGKDLTPDERETAKREYQFLQERVLFWQNYQYLPPEIHANMISAALELYQGAILSNLVSASDPLPKSYVDAATESQGTDGPIGMELRGAITGATQSVTETAAGSTNSGRVGLGGTVDASVAKIKWGKGIEDQGIDVEGYVVENVPGAQRLVRGSKAFDASVEETGEAISVKTIDTLSYSCAKNPREALYRARRYIRDASNYDSQRVDTDLEPSKIKSRTLHLFVRDSTSPEQWKALNEAVEYGRSRNNPVSVIITRVKG